jgi:protein gp37
MNKTKIEYANYTVNPITGTCLQGCPYCYANRMRHRFNWATEIRCDLDAYHRGIDIAKLKKSSRIFVGSMHDIFGNWISDNWIKAIIIYCQYYPQHTFLFLTKNPKRYAEFKFPDNCWLGVTMTGIEKDQPFLWGSISGMDNIKFISYEPLLGMPGFIPYYLTKPDWIIVGGLTPKPIHEIEWVKKILSQAKMRDIPVFLKDNLKYPEIIKEYPGGSSK